MKKGAPGTHWMGTKSSEVVMVEVNILPVSQKSLIQPIANILLSYNPACSVISQQV